MDKYFSNPNPYESNSYHDSFMSRLNEEGRFDHALAARVCNVMAYLSGSGDQRYQDALAVYRKATARRPGDDGIAPFKRAHRAILNWTDDDGRRDLYRMIQESFPDIDRL
jgi:hypothetical protein